MDRLCRPLEYLHYMHRVCIHMLFVVGCKGCEFLLIQCWFYKMHDDFGSLESAMSGELQSLGWCCRDVRVQLNNTLNLVTYLQVQLLELMDENQQLKAQLETCSEVCCQHCIFIIVVDLVSCFHIFMVEGVGCCTFKMKVNQTPGCFSTLL